MKTKAQKVKHTPGPWVAREQGEADQWAILTADRKGWVIGLIHNGEQHIEVQRANLRVMTAAPELLSALERMTGEFLQQIQFSVEGGSLEKFNAALEQARAAIAKAEDGQPA